MLKYFLSALTGAIICFLLLRTCTPVVQPIDTTKIDSVKHRYDSVVIKNTGDSLMYTQINNQLQTALWTSKSTGQYLLGKLQDSISRIRFTLSKLRTARFGKDTVGIVKSCEEFEAEAEGWYEAAVVYKTQLDSTVNLLQQINANDSTEIKRLNSVIFQLKDLVTATQHFLEDAVAQNLELRHQLAKTKRGAKILAALGIVVGAVGVGMIK